MFISEGRQKPKKGCNPEGVSFSSVLEMEAEVVLRIDDNIFLLLHTDEKGVC